MRTQIAILASVVLLTGSAAATQTATAVGVDAFLRGDYNRAVEILKPIAERTFDRDYAAEFFMASLYEGGRGVPVDLVRACALYLRSASPGSPFETQGPALWRATRKRLTGEEADDCTSAASIGVNHGFQPRTFTLESDQWVAWNVRGATVTYNGRENHVDLAALRGSRFFPVQYTELAAGSSRSTRRHFMEVFAWVPVKPREWVLTWRFFEVVREELIQIAANDALATMAAEEPPMGDMSDVRRLVAVRTTDKGDAELAITSGPTPRTLLIETAAERQEAQRIEAARIEGRKKVDANRMLDVRRPPSFAYSDVQGCRGPFVHAWSDDRAEAIAVFASKEALRLSATPKQFDAFVQPERLEIQVHVYERATAPPFCTDMLPPPTNEEVWRAIGGRVTIDLVPVAARVHNPATDRVTIRIEGAVFVNSAGARVTAIQPIVLTTTLGRGGWGG